MLTALTLAPANAVALDAAAPPLVVVLTGHPDAPFVRRLAAELVLFGYRVDVQTRTESTGASSELLTGSTAALIAVNPGEGTAEIVVKSLAPGGSTHSETERLDPRRPPETNAAVLAERFRARLTELGISPTDAGLPPTVARREISGQPSARESPARRFWIAAALGASGGGLGLQPDALLEVRAFPVRAFSTSAFGRFALKQARVSAAEGSADVRLISAGLSIHAYPVHVSGFTFSTGVSLLVVNASMSGRVNAQAWSAQEDSVFAPAATLEARAASALSPNVSAELRGFFGTCAPRIGVHFDGHPVADYGQPLFGGSLGLAVGVF